MYDANSLHGVQYGFIIELLVFRFKHRQNVFMNLVELLSVICIKSVNMVLVKEATDSVREVAIL